MIFFRDQESGDRKSLTGPFLQQRGPHERICTVHLSGSDLCRNNLCSPILFPNRNGNKAGRVPKGTRSFTTENRRLLRDVLIPDDKQWEKYVDDIFFMQDTRSSGDYRMKIRPTTGMRFIPVFEGIAPAHRRIHGSRQCLPYPGCISHV
jgi:hypothetical protein